MTPLPPTSNIRNPHRIDALYDPPTGKWKPLYGRVVQLRCGWSGEEVPSKLTAVERRRPLKTKWEAWASEYFEDVEKEDGKKEEDMYRNKSIEIKTKAIGKDRYDKAAKTEVIKENGEEEGKNDGNSVQKLLRDEKHVWNEVEEDIQNKKQKVSGSMGAFMYD